MGFYDTIRIRSRHVDDSAAASAASGLLALLAWAAAVPGDLNRNVEVWVTGYSEAIVDS